MVLYCWNMGLDDCLFVCVCVVGRGLSLYIYKIKGVAWISSPFVKLNVTQAGRQPHRGDGLMVDVTSIGQHLKRGIVEFISPRHQHHQHHQSLSEVHKYCYYYYVLSLPPLSFLSSSSFLSLSLYCAYVCLS